MDLGNSFFLASRQTSRLSELKAPDSFSWIYFGFSYEGLRILRTMTWTSLSFFFSRLRILCLCHLPLPRRTTHSMRACLHFPPRGCLRDGAQFRKADFNSAFLFTGRNESSSAGRAGLRESRRQACEHVRKCSRASTFAPPRHRSFFRLARFPSSEKSDLYVPPRIPPVSNL